MSKKRNRRAFSLPDEYLKEIGHLITSFAALEEAIKINVGAIIGNTGSLPVATVITSEMSFKNLVALFSSLFRLKAPSATALVEMESLVKTAMDVEGKRNRIVHSRWGVRHYKEGGQAVIRNKTTAKISKGLNRQEEELTLEALADLVDEVINATKASTDFLYKYLMPDSPVEPPYGRDSWT